MRAALHRLFESIRGLSPHSVGLILSIGLVLGTFPMVGAPTLLCFAAAAALRLNMPALQLVNQLSSPLQYLLLIPYAQLGARFFGAPHRWNLVAAARQALAGWCCLALPAGVLLYFLTVSLIHLHRAAKTAKTNP